MSSCEILDANNSHNTNHGMNVKEPTLVSLLFPLFLVTHLIVNSSREEAQHGPYAAVCLMKFRKCKNVWRYTHKQRG